MSIDGIKLKSIQVAAPYTKREDPRKTPKILVDYGTERQQTTRNSVEKMVSAEDIGLWVIVLLGMNLFELSGCH